jgi:hypothetical protein
MVNMKRLWILGLFAALPMWGQLRNPFPFIDGSTVARLPAASAATHQFWGVYDGASSSDCSTGGGTTPVICWSNGTTWSAVTSSGGGTTTNALTAATSGGAAPNSTFNGSAAVTFDYHSFGAGAALPNCTPETSSFNAAATGCYALTGSTASTGTVTATVSTGLLIQYWNNSSTTLTVAASAGPTLTCYQGGTSSCSIAAGGSATIYTVDGTNLAAFIPAASSGGGAYSILFNGSISFSASPEYLPFPVMGAGGAVTTINTYCTPIATAQTIDTLGVAQSTADAASSSSTYTLTYGAACTSGSMAATTLTCTVAAAGTACSDSTHSFSAAAGGFIGFRITYTGTPGSTIISGSVRAH